MNRHSIRFRLTAWYALILAATFAIAGLALWWTLRSSIHETVDKDLRFRLQALRNYLQTETATPQQEPISEELTEDATLSGARFRILGNDGRWVYQSPEATQWGAIPANASQLPIKGTIQTVRVNRRPMRVLSAPVQLGPAQPGVAQIGVPIGAYYEMLDGFTWTVLLASPLVLLLASVGGYWMSRRALEPVDQIARTAEAIGAQNLSQRLPLRGAGDELDRLSSTLNSMFARLEAAFRQITQFTADASHELRTPVAIIRTTAELARSKQRSEEEYKKALDSILTESERTSRLIEDLMLLARADAGSDGIVQESVNITESLREACAEVRILAEYKGVRLDANLSGNCSILGDSQALRRLFVILLDNAIKYTPSGGEVGARLSMNGPAAKPGTVIEIRDTGVGISADDLPHVFERFYRASKDRSRTTGGAGLGLSIAQWIAIRHGGNIQAESSLGAGSVFRVYLPG